MATDVLKIALERRDRLHAEIEQLDEFIRTAEQLIRSSQSTPRSAHEEVDTPGASRINLLRRGHAAVG